MELGKYSLGIGDRFGFEGAAQLRALQKAEALGVQVTPVWNKSNREHSIIGTSPDDTRLEADKAVDACRWQGPHFVDADHIGLATVDRFLSSSDFFTIDVADYIGKPAKADSTASFIKAMDEFRGTLSIPGTHAPFDVTEQLLDEFSQTYLRAIEEAGKVYRYIAEKKGEDTFIPEVSTDEASSPQTPAELFLLLAAINHEGIPLQTIAPKFSGAFLKGVDYVGDIHQFTRAFEDDLAVVAFAVKTFGFPNDLKLSVHSGSDKFSLYDIIHKILKKFDAGLHLKTAGTTWLEEVIGLAASGGKGLKLVKEIYAEAIMRYDELCKPYLTVIDINRKLLPDPAQVNTWSSKEFVETLRHDQKNPRYNVHFRQLVHVAFRIAAEMGSRYKNLLMECRQEIESNVTTNLFERHIRPLFLGQQESEKGRSTKKSGRVPA
jgi:hypothetical protein